MLYLLCLFLINVQLTPLPHRREAGGSFEALSFHFLYPGHFQHLVQSARLDLLGLVPSYRNKVRIIGMYILVMPFPLLDCPAVPFNQLVKLGVLHDVKDLLLIEHCKSNDSVPITQVGKQLFCSQYDYTSAQ